MKDVVRARGQPGRSDGIRGRLRAARELRPQPQLEVHHQREDRRYEQDGEDRRNGQPTDLRINRRSSVRDRSDRRAGPRVPGRRPHRPPLRGGARCRNPRDRAAGRGRGRPSGGARERRRRRRPDGRRLQQLGDQGRALTR